jgi:hypothetical protein
MSQGSIYHKSTISQKCNASPCGTALFCGKCIHYTVENVLKVSFIGVNVITNLCYYKLRAQVYSRLNANYL